MRRSRPYSRAARARAIGLKYSTFQTTKFLLFNHSSRNTDSSNLAAHKTIAAIYLYALDQRARLNSMSLSRRHPGYKYKYVGSVNTSTNRKPETVYPPEGYCLIETDLHRAALPLQVASFPFLSQLKLRSAINLSSEPLDSKDMDFLRGAGVALLTPSSLDAFDGPYDLWEEAAKELLELLLEADNQPMILLDSSTECESACLVGCLRRLQHWSICAIQDEYQMMTLRNTSYDTSQRFIERFDLDLVTLKGNLPAWFREHITMLEEERAAEEAMMRTDPDRPKRAWAQGLCPSHDELAAPGGDTVLQDYTKRCVIRGNISDVSPRQTTRDAAEGNQAHAVQGEDPPSPTGADEDGRKDAGASSEGAGDDGQGCGAKNKAAAGIVPDYRFNGFVYVCPLVSAKSRFTAKAWLQDEDD